MSQAGKTMRLLEAFDVPLPMAAMKSVLVPGAGGFALSPEILSVIAFAALAAIAIYVFLR
jgi:hypothetical protein